MVCGGMRRHAGGAGAWIWETLQQPLRKTQCAKPACEREPYPAVNTTRVHGVSRRCQSCEGTSSVVSGQCVRGHAPASDCAPPSAVSLGLRVLLRDHSEPQSGACCLWMLSPTTRRLVGHKWVLQGIRLISAPTFGELQGTRETSSGFHQTNVTLIVTTWEC